MQTLGTFRPSPTPDTDEARAMEKAGALFIASPTAGDWYAVAHSLPNPTNCAVVSGGLVKSVATDPTTLFPVDSEVVTGVPDAVRPGWLWNGAVFGPPPTPPAQKLVSFSGRSFSLFNSAKLSLAVNLANAAIAGGVRAGDMRWLDKSKDFTWPDATGVPVPMDAPTLIALAGAIYAG